MKDRMVLMGAGVFFYTVVMFRRISSTATQSALAGFLLASVLLALLTLAAIPFARVFAQAAVASIVISRWGKFTNLPTDSFTVALAYWATVAVDAFICFAASVLAVNRYA
jgi:hypothetical protein